MHALVTGAAGMIGRKLAERLGRNGALNGAPDTKLTLTDIVMPSRPPVVERRAARPRKIVCVKGKIVCARGVSKPPCVFRRRWCARP